MNSVDSRRCRRTKEMFQNAGEVLHASTGREEDHDLRWTLFIDEMNQLTEFLVWFTNLFVDKRWVEHDRKGIRKPLTM